MMKSISGKKFCKIVEKKGWVLKRIQGSHHIYKKKDTKDIIVIPVHKKDDLKIGLLKSIMKIADISRDEL